MLVVHVVFLFLLLPSPLVCCCFVRQSSRCVFHSGFHSDSLSNRRWGVSVWLTGSAPDLPKEDPRLSSCSSSR